jgi:hypothetical protein
VRDGEGRPVAGAWVQASRQGGSAGLLPRAMSKADGSFTLDVWGPDTFYVSAEHLGGGYPDAMNGFYGKFFGEALIVEVGESNRMEPVEVRVGPKAGRVIFKLFDEQSGRRVRSGMAKMCRTDDPRVCWSTSRAFPRGRFELLTPEVPFTIRFEVWEKDWERREALGEDGAPVELLRVDSGGRKELKIKLRRVRGGE